jgi:GTPase SAR1 family protein
MGNIIKKVDKFELTERIAEENYRPPNEDITIEYKIVMFGPSGVGKSYLCSKLLGTVIKEDDDYTLKCQIGVKVISISEEEIVVIEIYDVPVNDIDSKIVSDAIMNANSILYLFDASDETDHSYLEMQKIYYNINNKKQSENRNIFIIASKSEEDDIGMCKGSGRNIDVVNEAREWSETMNYSFLETSYFRNQGITKLRNLLTTS